jgi:predicted amidohydrolase YtcJ
MDGSARTADAVAVWHGRILAVGTDDEIDGLIGKSTRKIDLAGRTVVPGIVDSHCHPDHHAIDLLHWRQIGWPEIRSVDDMLKMVERECATMKPDGMFRGFGYNDQKCGGYPTRDQLDAVSNNVPVWLYRTDGHIAIVNSATLRHFGVAEDATDPRHGQYDRHPETGRMTGLLREMAAWDLDARMKRDYRVEDYEEGLPQVFDLYLKHGVTSLHNSLTQGKAIQAYQQLRERQRLAMRIGIILDGRDEALVDTYIRAGVRTGFGDEWIRIVGVEWCPDCSTSGRTAAYYEPYIGTPVPGEPVPNTGMLLYDADELFPQVARAHKAGLRVCVEGLGDRGIDFALDAIEAALRERPVDDHRSRVEHCCYVTPPILERIRKLGVVDSSATGFMYTLGDAYIANRGSQAMNWMFPHRSLIDAGVPAPGHSDAPICGTSPWEIIGALVTRKTDSGQDFGPAQAISITEAVHAYTTLGAWAGFEEDIKGSIEPGKLADFAVLDRDPFAIDPDDIKNVVTDITIVGGEVRYEA